MHLKEFVKDALIEIIQGIKAAQDQPGAGGYIAPEGIGDHEFPRDGGVLNSQMIVSTVVKFDVAVTAESSVDGGGVQNCVSRLSKQISGLRVIQRTLKCRGFSFRYLL